ncbi:hypothetical protein KC19_9G045400 [Ceratodon purpureus]|uniref:Uncharacterized protein n=1 Tax=Ceratodon purpureus TaxID=3225 RepID=A0A8T0GU56_CERPU|nr:hypothetical protein KC19_9G045400 [Ceratodon purpureus]
MLGLRILRKLTTKFKELFRAALDKCLCGCVLLGATHARCQSGIMRSSLEGIWSH